MTALAPGRRSTGAVMGPVERSPFQADACVGQRPAKNKPARLQEPGW